MGVLVELRRRRPELLVSETHPKVLHFALRGVAHHWKRARGEMCAWIAELARVDSTPQIADDHA